MTVPFWTQTEDEVLKYFQTNRNTGLTDSQVESLRAKYGRNELPKEEGTPFWKLILNQFEDQLVRILMLAAVISFVLALFEEHEEQLTSFVEALVIVLILIANATVGVIQETNAEKAIEALKAYESENAVVLRNGKIQTIKSTELVPGDVVEVSVGNRIPADLRLLEQNSVTFRVDQSILTGESNSVSKSVEPVADPKAVNQDKTNILFSGTNITIGKARGIVVGTGLNTAIGEIRLNLMQMDEVQSPLKKKLDEFGESLSKVITVICILVWLVNINHFADPAHGGVLRGAIYYFKIAVALAVAAIPEGLPAVVTTCLALGAVKMAKKNAIVRSLPSVESLGCTTVICSDKTGTLTTNKMSVCRALYFESQNGTVKPHSFRIEGTSFAPYGNIIDMSNNKQLENASRIQPFEEMAKISALCNDSSIEYLKEHDSFERVGEATEVALKVFVEKVGIPEGGLDRLPKDQRVLAANHHWEKQLEKLVTLEFTRDRKSMSVLVKHKSGNSLYVKGAPEGLLERCDSIKVLNTTSNAYETQPLNAQAKQALQDSLKTLSNEALRCIGLATIENAKDKKQYDFSTPDNFIAIEQGMTFVGVVAMLDPPRPEVPSAVRICKQAGIRVVVITGDNKATAESICRKIGVFGENEDLTGKSYTGREFDELTPQQQKQAVLKASLFSRTEPSHKAKLVDLLQENSEVVAMTGDGVNDAPALKKADIGIAMGSGTAVAKAASKMILADDNFATIVSSVEEGRGIYNNTKQFIRYLISSNIGEVVCIFLTAVLGMPEVLVPVQLLWVNLVTDGLPATALSMNKSDRDIMKQPPRGRFDPIINTWLFIRYLVIGVYIGLATIGGFIYWYLYFENGPHLSWSNLTTFHTCSGDACDIYTHDTPATIALSILVTIEMFNALNSLSENGSLLQIPPWSNKWLLGAITMSFALHFMILYVPFFSMIFGTTPLTVAEWKVVFWFSFPVVLLDEFLKLISRLFVTPKKN
eukprot:TRINITY_DN2020_c0_g2_i1.p1 TRINITY_DN2020_c0_g2~~TRINITY_DN2020_c0_g2_i1.p1  ORF type:complete len:989 (-),score=222.24 TRINITY_DN2020_c0_g2_i1:59-3025(-)